MLSLEGIVFEWRLCTDNQYRRQVVSLDEASDQLDNVTKAKSAMSAIVGVQAARTGEKSATPESAHVQYTNTSIS